MIDRNRDRDRQIDMEKLSNKERAKHKKQKNWKN